MTTCASCGHAWSLHPDDAELDRGVPHCRALLPGLDPCLCQWRRAARVEPPGSRMGGETLAHLDAVAVAARNLFEALQLATAQELRREPAPLATECRHCGRALQLGPTPGQDPLLFSSVSWLDAGGSASCHGQVLTSRDPGTYLPHEPMPTRSDPTGLPLHRCPGCQMLHPYPVEV